MLLSEKKSIVEVDSFALLINQQAVPLFSRVRWKKAIWDFWLKLNIAKTAPILHAVFFHKINLLCF